VPSRDDRVFGEEEVNMTAILYAIATWVLLQLLFVCFCARLAALRVGHQDHRKRQAYRARNRLGVSAHEAEQQSLPGVPSRHQPPPAGIAVTPVRALEEPGRIPLRSDRLCAAAQTQGRGHECRGLNV
jgi:hypothetical protein